MGKEKEPAKQPSPAPAQPRPVTHHVIPAHLFDAIHQRLRNRPWIEVNDLMVALTQQVEPIHEWPPKQAPAGPDPAHQGKITSDEQ